MRPSCSPAASRRNYLNRKVSRGSCPIFERPVSFIPRSISLRKRSYCVEEVGGLTGRDGPRSQARLDLELDPFKRQSLTDAQEWTLTSNASVHS